MLTAYLVVLWFVLTLFWSGSDRLRGNGAVFVLWFALSAAVLWPVMRWASTNDYMRAVVSEIQSDFRAEVEAMK